MIEQNTVSISELQKQANNGDAQAQFDLAYRYACGADVEQDREQSLMWLTKAAEQGLVNAQLLLGFYYSSSGFEDFIFTDYESGYPFMYNWVTQKRQGYVDPGIFHNIFVMDYHFHGDKKQCTDAIHAFDWFKKAAAQDCAEAQYRLACFYDDGIGVEHCTELAFAWYKKAAEQVFAEAYYYLASCYRDGKGVAQNDQLAFDWITKAAEQADVYFGPTKTVSDYGRHVAEVYFFLGDLYAQGKGIAQSDELAFKFYKLATERDYDIGAEAQYRIAEYYLNGIVNEQDFKLAEYGFEKFAEQGNAEAQYRLAKYYLYGDGVEKDHSIGMNWLIRAVQANHAEAYQWLENTYLNFVFPYFSGRKEIDQCHKFAFEWLLSGYEQTPEDFEINFGLAVLYAFGKGVEKNQELAVKHFIACKGECYEDHARAVAENFTEIFYDFSALFNDISAGTVKSYYFDDLAPFFLAENPIARDTKKSYAVLPSLRIAFHLQMGEFELLKEFLNSFEDLESSFNYPSSKKNFKNMGLTANKQAEDIVQKNQELKEKNKRLQLEIQQKESLQNRMQKLVEQFTHSLGNVIFPDTIYQVAERLKNNPECRKDVLLLHEAYHSEIIIKLQGELLRQRYANTNPEKFRQLIRGCRRASCSSDRIKSIEDILDYASSRVTARFLNQHYAGLNSIRDRILSKKNVSLSALKQKFEDDILLNKSLRPIEWVNQQLRPIQITEISPLWKKVFILSESHAEALLFGYFSEILFNALKYADHDRDEFLTLVFDEKTINDSTYLFCNWGNPVKDKAPLLLGTGKGLDAIQEDLKQLNDTENPEESLLISQQKNQFQVTLFFKKDLLVNELSSLKIKRKADAE